MKARRAQSLKPGILKFGQRGTKWRIASRSSFMSQLGHPRRLNGAPITSGPLPSTDIARPARLVRVVPLPDSCTVTREAYSINASARPSNGRETQPGTVDQLLREVPAVLDACGTPDGLNNLGGVIVWIKSLSASVSNGLRSILKFEGAASAASL
jgi:hypothetical protein